MSTDFGGQLSAIPVVHRSLRAPRDIHSFAGIRYGMPDDPHTPGVKKRHEVSAALNRLANAQSGVVSREQARGQGVTDRLSSG